MSKKEPDVSGKPREDQPSSSEGSAENASRQEPVSAELSRSTSRYSNLRIWPAILFLAAMIVAKLLPSLIAAFGAFAAGFLVRPLGLCWEPCLWWGGG
jgi:hypothetical protein